ncbi:MAG: C40 family peptidase [Clostridia bacterium]|nr:C40 family peptidase [Clostridia bacterium]
MIHCIKRKTVKLVAALVVMIMMVSSVSGSVFAAEYTGVTMANVLNVRSEPNTDCTVVGQYIYGTIVDIVGVEGAWYKIKYNGVDAYLISDYVKLIDPSEASRYAVERTRAQRLLDIARQYIGTPYRYGGMSPSGFDCSGFTKYCYSQMGINLNRTAASQTAHGTPVSKDQLLPGDLVFFVTNGYNISHVGIYVGDGMMIHSPKPGYSVEVVTINSGYYANTYSTARRILD